MSFAHRFGNTETMRDEFKNKTVTELIKLRDEAWRKRKADNYSVEQADMDRISNEHGVPTETLPKQMVGGIVYGGQGGGLIGSGGDF